MSDSKSPRIYLIFQSISIRLYFWMVSSNPSVIVPSAPLIIGITVTFMFYSFFSSLARSRHLTFCFLLILFCTVQFGWFSFFLLSLDLVIWLRLGDPFSSLNHTKNCLFYFLEKILGYAYTIFFIWSNWNFLHNSQGITLPTQSYLVLYSLSITLLHSLIMWLIALSITT